MSYLIDTNVTIHASNSGSSLFAGSKKFIEKCTKRTDETWCITWVNIFEYIRIVTHPSIFTTPMISREAEANIQSIIGLPQVQVLTEQNNFFEIYTEITARAGPVAGNLVHDAHIAALMQQHGIRRIYTFDNHFRIFSFLEVINPLNNST